MKGTTMSKRRIVVGASAAALVAVSALSLAQVPGNADPAPQAKDVVGVGSDIVQSSVDFLADGDAKGDLGYNSAGNKWRIFNFDATADANGRNAFPDPAFGLPATQVLNPTIQLRAGTSPVQRPNGGSAGLTALEGDTNGYISFARTPNLLKAADQSKPVGALHEIQFADDTQFLATSSDSYAPPALSASDLYEIYTGAVTTWQQLKDYDPSVSITAGHESDAIYAERPQNGAGVLTVFQNKLLGSPQAVADSATVINWGGNVHAVQQNDPTTITSLASDAQRRNAIVPFPKGRYDLYNSGYFLQPNTAYNSATPPAPLSASGIKLETGAGAFSADLPYYIVFRQADVTSTVPWQPGSTANWVKTLFYDPDHATDGLPVPFFASPAGQQLLTNIGLQPKYQDCGTGTGCTPVTF